MTRSIQACNENQYIRGQRIDIHIALPSSLEFETRHIIWAREERKGGEHISTMSFRGSRTANVQRGRSQRYLVQEIVYTIPPLLHSIHMLSL